jgi:hypothetical protein
MKINRDKESQLSAERLRTLLSYDPLTGHFTRLVSTSSNARAGDVVGRVDAKGYSVINIGGQKFKAHRLAWLASYGKWPTLQIDHIDTKKDNNRLSNLREATGSEQRANTNVTSRNKLGIKGIRRNGNGFAAEIKTNGERIYLGTFLTAEIARAAYEKAAKEASDSFARFTPANDNEKWREVTERPATPTGIRGVHYNKGIGKFVVRIRIGGKQTHLGAFPNIEDAKAAYAKAAYAKAANDNNQPAANAA